jgi:hypothetical protein
MAFLIEETVHRTTPRTDVPGTRPREALISTTIKRPTSSVVGLSATTITQQAKIEDLTARVIRLETALDIALAARGTSATKRLPRATKNRS